MKLEISKFAQTELGCIPKTEEKKQFFLKNITFLSDFKGIMTAGSLGFVGDGKSIKCERNFR